jgi:hypothetical protein
MTSCAATTLQVIGVQVSEKAVATDQSGLLKFSNLRSQLHWQFREDLDPANNRGIALPPDAKLRLISVDQVGGAGQGHPRRGSRLDHQAHRPLCRLGERLHPGAYGHTASG